MKANKENGYTLIEMLIAITILSIGILALASMQIWGIQGNATAKWHTEAATSAADRIEQLMTLPYADITDGTATQGDYTLSWTVDEDDPIDNTKTITVTVRWWDKKKPMRSDFIYYKADL